MVLKVRTLAELPAELRPQLPALDWSTNDPPFDVSTYRKAQALGIGFAPFRAVFAVEDGQVLARVAAVRRTFRTEERAMVFSGVTDVVTRPDGMGRGYALRLMRAVHRLERTAGIEWAFLWTQRSWGAHRIYEKLGYRDLFSPPFALKRMEGGRPTRLPKGYSLRGATRRDTSLLESLFERATRDRVGLVPRPRGSLRFRFALGWRTPSDHRLLLKGGRCVGYLYGTRGPRHVSVTEGVVLSPEHLPALMDAAERVAAGRWLVFGSTTLVRDAALILTERGFSVYGPSHATLMALRLNPGSPTTWADLRRTVADPGFSSQRADIF